MDGRKKNAYAILRRMNGNKEKTYPNFRRMNGKQETAVPKLHLNCPNLLLYYRRSNLSSSLYFRLLSTYGKRDQASLVKSKKERR
jgi:hypothetical protein